LPRRSRELTLAMKRVAAARLLVDQYRARIAKLIREGKPATEQRDTLAICESALENLIEHERRIRKARREKYKKP